MIAVDRRHQASRHRAFAARLNALKRAVSAANLIGLKAVVLDVIEDGGPGITEKRRAFYLSMGFKSLPTRPLRMFISIDTVRNSWTQTTPDDT